MPESTWRPRKAASFTAFAELRRPAVPEFDHGSWALTSFPNSKPFLFGTIFAGNWSLKWGDMGMLEQQKASFLGGGPKEFHTHLPLDWRSLENGKNKHLSAASQFTPLPPKRHIVLSNQLPRVVNLNTRPVAPKTLEKW